MGQFEEELYGQCVLPVETRALGRPSTIRWWFVPTTALFLTAALCEPRTDIVLVNETSQTVQIVAIDESGRETIVDELAPGDTAFSSEQCYSDLTAPTLDGIVLAQRPGPMCQGDPPWVVTENTTTT